MNRSLTFVSLRSAGISFTSPARRSPTQHVLKTIPFRSTKRILCFLFLIAPLKKIFFMQPDYPSSHIIEHTILHTVIPYLSFTS